MPKTSSEEPRGGTLRYDAVVVGGGGPAMISAAIMARNGLSVALFEEGEVISADSQILTSDGMEIDTGLCWIESENKIKVVRKVIEQLGLLDEIEFYDLASARTVVTNERVISWHGDLDCNASGIARDFSEDKSGVIQFCNTVHRVREVNAELSLLFLERGNTPMEALKLWAARWKCRLKRRAFLRKISGVGVFADGLIYDSHLKEVMLSSASFASCNVASMPISIFAALNCDFCSKSCSIRGGTSRLIELAKRVFEENGGKLFLGYRLQDIEYNDTWHFVEKLKFRNLADESGGHLEVGAGHVVYGGNPSDLFRSFLHGSPARDFRIALNKNSVRNSVYSLYFILNKSLSSLQWDAVDTLIVPDQVSPFCINNERRSRIAGHTEKPFSFINYSQFDLPLTVNPEGRDIVVVTFPEKYGFWGKLSPEERVGYVERITRHVVLKMETVIPGFQDAVSKSFIVRPGMGIKSSMSDAFVENGLLQRVDQIRYYSKIFDDFGVHNLYCASSWTSMTGGVASSIQIAGIVANKITTSHCHHQMTKNGHSAYRALTFVRSRWLRVKIFTTQLLRKLKYYREVLFG